MAIRIPTSNLSKYTQLVSIDGTAYTIGFDWNSRDETWHMSISTADEEAIVVGIKILPAVNLTARFKDTRLPNGSFVCFNTKDSITAPNRNGLLEEVQIWFLTPAEVSLLPDGFAKVI